MTEGTIEKATVKPDVAVALDGMTLAQATVLVDQLGPSCTWVKVGLELYTRHGPDAVSRFKERGQKVFLDLKLHDIPNTVASAVRAAHHLGADLLTTHASGGSAMIEAARAVVDEERSSLRLLAVTVLTSMDAAALSGAWGTGTVPDIPVQVERLARLAIDAGAHGVVSSAQEAALLRRSLGPEPLLVTPGIRLAGGAVGDQKRVMTPSRAAAAGANLLVVGRPIRQADDPASVLQTILAELEVGSSS